MKILLFFLMFGATTASCCQADHEIISEATRYKIRRSCQTCQASHKILYTLSSIDQENEREVCYTCAQKIDPEGAQNFKNIMNTHIPLLPFKKREAL